MCKTIGRRGAFAVVLPDVIIDQYSSDLKQYNLTAMLKRYHETSASQILVEPVPKESVSNYGVVDCNSYELKPGESKMIKGVVENLKLKRRHPIYRLLVVMYCQRKFGLY